MTGGTTGEGTTGPDAEDRLLRELVAALGPPDAPPAAVEAARAVFTWRTVDAELAALVHDSALTGPAAGVRGAGDAAVRSLTFSTDEVTIDVDLDASGLVGQVVPPGGGSVEVRVGGAAGAAAEGAFDVDALGTFAVRPLPTRPFQLLLDDGTRRVVTAWIAP